MVHLLKGLTSRSSRLVLATLLVAAAGAFALNAEAAADGVGGAGGPGMHGGMRGGEGGPGMGLGLGMMGNPHRMERVLDSVNASAEQRTQIRQIMQTAHADMKNQHQAGKALHEQNRALFAQPNVDARAVETNRQQLMAQHEAASKRMSQVMLDVSRVLSPDQRKQLSERMAERMTERSAMMQRHQAERGALDKKP